jgi:hypothetical protein
MHIDLYMLYLILYPSRTWILVDLDTYLFIFGDLYSFGYVFNFGLLSIYCIFLYIDIFLDSKF